MLVASASAVGEQNFDKKNLCMLNETYFFVLKGTSLLAAV
jgi:hypothetical protein